MRKYTTLGIEMDGYLVGNLRSIVHDAQNDFDFVIVITGDGNVRVGKSVLAQQVAWYLAESLDRPFSVDNIVFSGEELIKAANNSPPSVFIYDEARAELDSKKTMNRVSAVLQDFFAECGMLNHIVILVLPDFFELNKRIAIARSECLLNVTLIKEKTKVGVNKAGEDQFILTRKRGLFYYYGKEKKRWLYINGKKNNDDYRASTHDFYGFFKDQWVVDKAAYNEKKSRFLKRDRETKAKPTFQKWKDQRDALIRELVQRGGYTVTDVSRIPNLDLKQPQVSNIMAEKPVLSYH